MNKMIAGLVVLIVLAGGGFLYEQHNSNKSSSDMSGMDMSKTSKTTSTTTPAASTPAAASSSSSSSTATKVTIANFAFSPATTTVKVGDTVTWTNSDSTAHTVTADTASSDAPSSGNIDPGSSYSFTFKKAGTYKYHCAIHSSMTGTVVVE